MKNLTFKEHLFLSEARDPKRKYTEKQAKGVLDRVTVELSSSEAAVMSRLGKRYMKLETLLEKMKKDRDELNAKLKTEVADLFDAEDMVITRVVETAQVAMTLSKQVKKPDSESVDYEAVAKALMGLIDKELEPKINEIIKMHTKIVAGKEPAATLRVTTNEGVGDWLAKARALFSSFLSKVTSWATRFDDKLDAIKSKAGIK